MGNVLVVGIPHLVGKVGSTIPAPADTAGTLWTATALPTTHNNGRLCTISCQNAETLVVFKADAEYPEPWGFVNVKKPEGARLPLWWKRGKPGYGTLPNAVRFEFHTLAEAERLLAKERALDACYRANAELMRPCMVERAGRAAQAIQHEIDHCNGVLI